MSKKKSSSRSALVRQRRRKQGKSSYRELPPITSRGVVNDFAIERRKKATKKRRFNAVLSLPRPIARALPTSNTKIHVGWRLLSFIMVLLLGAGLYLFWSLPEFRVNAAQITGNLRIPADEINTALELNGRPIFLLTPSYIREQALRAFPELASVEAAFELPNVLTVTVTERQPVIQWQQDGGFAWIDETGRAFRPRGEVPGLIVVQAMGAPPAVTVLEQDTLSPSPFITEETVEALVALAPHVPAGTPILYDRVTGFSWTDSRGWQAVFGSGENMEVKALVYQAMVNWLTQRGTQPNLINVAYPDAPFYRVEQVDLQVEEQ
ncbi:MAG: FtsQ-type POTRA domain-containing protein [Anaerolineales bacterium]|jgi:hypothetical protein